MALAIEMNWRLSKSTTLGTNNSTQNGMGWLCIDVDMSYSSRSGYRNNRCWSRHNSQFRSTQISLTTHMAERSPLLLCILPTKGMSFVFATHCLLILVHSCVLCMLTALSTYVSKTTLVVDAQRFV